MTSTRSRARPADLERAVAAFIEEEGLLSPGAGVAVAVSAGGDSVALVHILAALARAGAGYRLSVAHLNHRLRPTYAERDEAFVRRLADRLGLPFLSEAREVRAVARERRLNLEAGARAVRYEFLERAAEELGARYVATGHTRDDQLETILWRLQRTDDVHGLAAIPPRRPIREGSPVTLVRPLLGISRQALRAYLSHRRIPWLTDHTNLDLSRTRNLIRRGLLVRCREELGEGYLRDLLDLARRVARLNRRSRELVAEVLERGARRSERGLVLEVDWLRGLPAGFRSALLYRALRRMELESAPPGRFLDSRLTRAHLRAVLGAVESERAVLIDQLPGDLIAERTGGELIIGARGARPTPSAVPPRRLPPRDGQVEVPELGLCVEVRYRGRKGLDWQGWLRRRGPEEEMLDAEALGPPGRLLLRTRRAGDRIRPLGAPGRKSLKKFFIDRKVPRSERNRTLLLARGSEVLWVAGVTLGDGVKVGPETRRLLHLRAERLGPRSA